jgi:prevent-host-death family protein
MARTMTVSEARAALPRLLDRVADGEEVTITRHGRPVAVLIRPDALRVRRADEALAAADRLAEHLARARALDLVLAPSLTAEQADELVAHVRAERNR